MYLYSIVLLFQILCRRPDCFLVRLAGRDRIVLTVVVETETRLAVRNRKPEKCSGGHAPPLRQGEGEGPGGQGEGQGLGQSEGGPLFRRGGDGALQEAGGAQGEAEGAFFFFFFVFLSLNTDKLITPAFVVHTHTGRGVIK